MKWEAPPAPSPLRHDREAPAVDPLAHFCAVHDNYDDGGPCDGSVDCVSYCGRPLSPEFDDDDPHPAPLCVVCDDLKGLT